MLQPPSEICPLSLEIDDSKCFGNRAVTMVGRGDVTAPEKNCYCKIEESFRGASSIFFQTCRHSVPIFSVNWICPSPLSTKLVMTRFLSDCSIMERTKNA